MGRLMAYADVLNGLFQSNELDLEAAEKFWVQRVNEYFQSKPFSFKLDASKSLRFCVRHLLSQAVERQREAKGTMYAGAVMQHLVGAKLDLITGRGVEHYACSVISTHSSSASCRQRSCAS